MPDAVIVSASQKSAAYLKDMLMQASFEDIVVFCGAGEVRRFFIDNTCRVCLINAPLNDETGETLASEISSQGLAMAVLLTDAANFDEISAKVEDSGVMTISKPVNKTLLWNTIKIAKAASLRLDAMRDENLKLTKRIEDIRIVDRAKYILITNMSMTEAQAHRYIEKQAMDSRTTRRNVAERILRTYEN
mgnify:CR=1 FL=1